LSHNLLITPHTQSDDGKGYGKRKLARRSKGTPRKNTYDHSSDLQQQQQQHHQQLQHMQVNQQHHQQQQQVQQMAGGESTYNSQQNMSGVADVGYASASSGPAANSENFKVG